MNHQTDTPKGFIAVSGHTRLFRREGGTYYFRAKVPEQIRPIISKTEIRISLRTKSLKEARSLVKIESLRADREFATAEAIALRRKQPQQKLSREEVAWIVSDYVIKADYESEEWINKARDEQPESEVRAIAFDLAEDAHAIDSHSRDAVPYTTESGVGYLDRYLESEGARSFNDLKINFRAFSSSAALKAHTCIVIDHSPSPISQSCF